MPTPLSHASTNPTLARAAGATRCCSRGMKMFRTMNNTRFTSHDQHWTWTQGASLPLNVKQEPKSCLVGGGNYTHLQISNHQNTTFPPVRVTAHGKCGGGPKHTSSENKVIERGKGKKRKTQKQRLACGLIHTLSDPETKVGWHARNKNLNSKKRDIKRCRSQEHKNSTPKQQHHQVLQKQGPKTERKGSQRSKGAKRKSWQESSWTQDTVNHGISSGSGAPLSKQMENQLSPWGTKPQTSKFKQHKCEQKILKQLGGGKTMLKYYKAKK